MEWDKVDFERCIAIVSNMWRSREKHTRCRLLIVLN